MASDFDGLWERVPLGDLVRINHGCAFKGEFFADTPPGDILLTPGNFAIGGGFRWGKRKYYRGPVDARYVLGAGELIISMTDLSKASDTLGSPAIVPPTTTESRLLHNQRLGRVEITAPNRLAHAFLYDALRADQYRRQIVATATGTTVKHTSPTKICESVILLPPIEEQRRINAILCALDDKIDSNRRFAALLEETVATLFRARFVDFFGVEEFEDSEMGRIPRGWSSARWGDACEVLPGRYLAKDDYDFDGRHVIYGSNSIMGRSSNALYEGPLTVLARIGSNCGALRFSQAACWVNNNACAVVARDTIGPYWLHHALQEFDFDRVRQGSGQPFIGIKALLASPLALPSRPQIVDFDAFAKPLYEKADALARENETLSALRDTLLPKLISGELRVAV